MIEIIHAITEFAFDERGLALSTWVLSFVTALDAKVGIRIYTRMTILINILSGKLTSRKAVEAEPEPTPEAQPLKTLNGGHFRA